MNRLPQHIEEALTIRAREVAAELTQSVPNETAPQSLFRDKLSDLIFMSFIKGATYCHIQLEQEEK